MHVDKHPDPSRLAFFRRTIAAQIHGLAFLLVLVGMVLLLPRAWERGVDHFWACAVFLITGAMVFLTSCSYHFLHDGFRISPKLELLLEFIDHSCIYLFIAGTYTPVLLNAVDPPWRQRLLFAVWVIAVLGILYTLVRPHLFQALQSRGVYTALFVAMGWLFLVRVGEIYLHLSFWQIVFLLAGVAAYLLGAVGYATQRPVLLVGLFGYHELWHTMVLLGALFHFLLVFSFYRVGVFY
ncbi:hemolysin III family protein [bacterium]|nr:hemolysin III family protein [bacterium]